MKDTRSVILKYFCVAQVPRISVVESIDLGRKIASLEI